MAEAVRWPFQAAFQFPDNPPAMPRMVSSRRPKGDLVFQSKKMLRPVRCESGIERAFFAKLDRLREVLWFHEQAPKVKYRMHGESHDYYPDALVALRNGHVFVAEVKTVGDFALYETICKVNALTNWAHTRGHGVFLGNDSRAVGDFVNQDVPRSLRAAVLSACKAPAGMSADRWRTIRQWSRRRHGTSSGSLQSLALTERLVITEGPFNVRRADPEEEKEIDAFVRRFEVKAPVLPLSAPSRRPATPRAAGLAAEVVVAGASTGRIPEQVTGCALRSTATRPPPPSARPPSPPASPGGRRPGGPRVRRRPRTPRAASRGTAAS